MSRIGKNPIEIPDKVEISVDDGVVKVKGPKGELEHAVRPEIKVKVEDNEVVAEIVEETKQAGAFWGMTRAIIANMIHGVVEGYEKKLELVGVGYRAKPAGTGKISLSVGYSNPIEFEAPEGITLEVEDQKQITVKGFDKQLVGLTASNIRKVRPPEPYKGKGIRYADEIVRTKPGKAGKIQQ